MRVIDEIKKYNRYLIYSTKGMLKSEVSSSYLNTLWWILDPLFYMIVYSFVSVAVFKAQQEYYQIYIIIGVVVWNFYNKVLQGSVKLISMNLGVISKVYIPKYIFLLRLILINLFKLIISYGLIVVMMFLWRVQLSCRILMIFPYTIILALLAFGIGMILMHIGVYVSDVSNILSVILRFQFYLSGIFYNMKSALPDYYIKVIKVVNPLYSLIEGIRENVLYNKGSFEISFIIWIVISLILSMFGLYLMYTKEGEYAKVS